MLSQLFATVLLATGAAMFGAIRASAAPTDSSKPQGCPPPPPPEPVFQATNYGWGCSPGGCSNGFNLSAAEGYLPGAPGFNVICNGIFIQQGWRECWLPDNSPLPDSYSVETIWTDGPDRERQYIGASHIFHRADGTTVNATGRTDIAPVQGMSFTIPVAIASV